MEEFGIKCMEKMEKKLEKKRDGDFGMNDNFGEKRSKSTKKVTFADSTKGNQTNRSGKHVANMHIDVVPDSMKIKRLKSAVNLCTDKVIESRPVTPWRYTGNKVE